jgi:hypothetical protein
MLNVLERVEADLAGLLRDRGLWKSLYIDYHPPVVERLWTDHDDCRVYLHRIHPCGPGEALFHPHPWPSAMRVLSGRYEMAVGFGPGDTPPPVAALIVAEAAAGGDFRYEMTHPDAWHYVRPIGGPSYSVMVTGRPWDRPSPRSGKKLRPLTDEEAARLFAWFAGLFPGTGRHG